MQKEHVLSRIHLNPALTKQPIYSVLLYWNFDSCPPGNETSKKIKHLLQKKKHQRQSMVALNNWRFEW